jgi:phosphopantothenoylcysteine synthetase/decarboxylase
VKSVLITAGPVYGRLDDNKLVGNRTRGIWASRFAEHLMKQGYQVTLLLADTENWEHLRTRAFGSDGRITVVTHHGYDDYAAKCVGMASTHDAAVMAAAVVNWIPANPITGKMPTKGFKEGDIIQVPFVLAARVIDKMR